MTATMGVRPACEKPLCPMALEAAALDGRLVTDVLPAERWAIDRKRLEAHASHLAAVVESSVDAIISTTVDGTIVSWNPGAERLYGYREDEVAGRAIDLLVPDGQHDALAQLRHQLVAGERVDHHRDRPPPPRRVARRRDADDVGAARRRRARRRHVDDRA